MDSPDQSAPPADKTEQVVYRCKICGIASPEPTCFAGIATEGPYRLQGTCITCNQTAQATGRMRSVFAIFGVLLMPLILLNGLKEKSGVLSPAILLAGLLIQPLTLILHELGHFLTARLLGLEAGLISLGVGPRIWKGNFLGVPLRVHGWPLSGRTLLGSHSMRFLRLRVWLTTLMGPGTNFILLAGAALFWDPLTHLFGANIVLLWMIFNGFYFLGNLLPYRSRRGGVLQRSDGLHLLRIPFEKSNDLAIYLSTTSQMGAFQLYEDQDYEGAQRACLKGLGRVPGDPLLSIMLSACHINLGDYEAGRAALESLSNSHGTLDPNLRALVENNLALALWLRDFNTARRDESSRRAVALLDHAYETYPCVLTYRTSRALLLAAIDRSQDALALLEYTNYETGSQADRAEQQLARAFALRRLNRNDEAEAALAAGLKLSKRQLPWLTTIGLVQK